MNTIIVIIHLLLAIHLQDCHLIHDMHQDCFKYNYGIKLLSLFEVDLFPSRNNGTPFYLLNLQKVYSKFLAVPAVP